MIPKFVSKSFLVKKGICSNYELEILLNSRKLKSYDANGYELSPYRAVRLDFIFCNEIYFFTEDIILLFGNRYGGNTKKQNEEHAAKWRELASSLQGRERLAALASACKHEKLSHSEAHDCLWPEKIGKTADQKRSEISKLKPVAQGLADAHSLEMPGWTAK